MDKNTHNQLLLLWTNRYALCRKAGRYVKGSILRNFLLFLLLVINASCASFKQVDLNDDQLERLLKPGKKISVTTNTDEKYLFKIDKYEEKVVYSKNQSFNLNDLKSIEIKAYSKTTKVLLVAGYIVAIVVVTDVVLNGIAESLADDLLFFL